VLTAVLIFCCGCSATTIKADPGIVVTSLSCSRSSVTPSGTTTCTVQVSGPAPSGGLGIQVTSSNAGVIVPTLVVVPTNAVSAEFTLQVSAKATAGNVTLTGTLNGVTKSFDLQVALLLRPQR